MKKPLTILLVLLLPALVNAQLIKNRWKAYRTEIHIGIGPTNFLGELGGANQIGTHYFKDLEFTQTRYAISGGVRYKISPNFAINTHLTFAKVAGDDALTTEFYRSYRNLSFKSNIWELNATFEGYILKEQIGHRYRLRGVRGRSGFEIGVYGFLGAGVFRFDPKAVIDGKTVRLQPLGTEGQGLIATREKYHLVQFCIPMGIGFKYSFSRRLGIGLEYGIRKTFTDYIDDVSKTYYDNNIIREQKGEIAAELADRSDRTFPNVTAPGQQRGDPRYKDTYMFAVFNVSYKLRTGRVSYPLF
jgi:hypothetical protein